MQKECANRADYGYYWDSLRVSRTAQEVVYILHPGSYRKKRFLCVN